ncbi:MAG: hypothetical protein LBE11_06730 [Prevotellaceae bacterium]|jgi:hypothetical protein|nr:hypothetical protein [Prevotellaceae bacterium]
MKSSQNKKIKSCKYGSTEFVSQFNRYSIYEVIKDELVFIDSPFIGFYCRECGEELKNGADFIV